MSERTYGEKCGRCSCLEHRRRGQSVEPIEFLTARMGGLPLRCPDCGDCQSNVLSAILMETTLDFFGPETREAVKAVREGRPHPIIDKLRIECNALSQTIDLAGERRFVADAQFDDADIGAHLHLTLTRALSGPSVTESEKP